MLIYNIKKYKCITALDLEATFPAGAIIPQLGSKRNYNTYRILRALLKYILNTPGTIISSVRLRKALISQVIHLSKNQEYAHMCKTN